MWYWKSVPPKVHTENQCHEGDTENKCPPDQCHWHWFPAHLLPTVLHSYLLLKNLSAPSRHDTGCSATGVTKLIAAEVRDRDSSCSTFGDHEHQSCDTHWFEWVLCCRSSNMSSTITWLVLQNDTEMQNANYNTQHFNPSHVWCTSPSHRHFCTVANLAGEWYMWQGGGVNKGVISQLMVSGSRLFMALQLRVNAFLY